MQSPWLPHGILSSHLHFPFSIEFFPFKYFVVIYGEFDFLDY